MRVLNQLVDLLILITLLISTTAGKTCSIAIISLPIIMYNYYIIIVFAVQAQFGCFTDPDCATAVVGGPSSNAEDCCVNNNAGLYYNDGGQCFQCIGQC